MAESTLHCPDGCFSVTYETDEDALILKDCDRYDDPVDPETFLNELGVPTRIARNGDQRCPNCGEKLTVDWGDDEDE